MIAVTTLTEAAAALMNDAAQERYTHAALLPYLNRAYGELERKLILIDSSKLKKTSDDMTVNSDRIDITNRDDNILDDLLRPIHL